MGWNTTVVVMNDALDQIAKDPKFGEKLASAIMHMSVDPKPADVSAGGGFINAATVIETHHNSGDVPVLVGGNCGRVMCAHSAPAQWQYAEDLRVVTALASKLGYNLTKKRRPKSK